MSWNWDAPPGASATRRTARKVVVSFIVGALSIGAAWAGTGLMPVRDKVDAIVGNEVPLPKAKVDKNFLAGTSASVETSEAEAAATYSPADLQPGQILGGSAKVSLFPRPEDYQEQFPGARWETKQELCETMAEDGSGASNAPTHVADFRVRWPENPDCLYMGGYGIGPMNAIGSWDDEYGLWARSIAMQDAQGDTLVLTLIDAVYWEAYYNSMCPGEPCGFLDLAQQLAEETGWKGTREASDPGALPPESFVFASTHSHTAMDFIGGWGGVPDWYMQQATYSLKASVRASLDSMQPAILEAGESILRARNGERRDFYRSAEDDTFSWFRLVDADNQPAPEVCTTPTKKKEVPVCTPASPGRAIATVGAYAAHPVTAAAGPGRADADFPAVFAKRVEEKFGGTGMFLQTGLGNMSPRGNKVEMGNGLADQVPTIGSGFRITNTDLSVGREYWDQPVTNVPLGSLGAAGFFDRKFNQFPATVNGGKGAEENKRCHSASPISVNTSVSAAKIGSLWITGGPG
jgi:hypothetical protein